MRKKDLVIWIFLVFKKAVTTNNIKVGFSKSGIKPLNFEAMQSKMGPNETFLPRSIIEVAHEKD